MSFRIVKWKMKMNTVCNAVVPLSVPNRKALLIFFLHFSAQIYCEMLLHTSVWHSIYKTWTHIFFYIKLFIYYITKIKVHFSFTQQIIYIKLKFNSDYNFYPLNVKYSQQVFIYFMFYFLKFTQWLDHFWWWYWMTWYAGYHLVMLD